MHWGYKMEFFRKNRKVILLILLVCLVAWFFGAGIIFLLF